MARNTPWIHQWQEEKTESVSGKSTTFDIKVENVLSATNTLRDIAETESQFAVIAER